MTLICPSLFQNCTISLVAIALENEVYGLVEGIGSVFDEDECVLISEECTITPSIRDVGHGEILRNLMCNPLMINRMTL